MDLHRHFTVIRRWRTLILIGVGLGVVLATLAAFKVSTGGIEWRQKESFQSDSVLLVTQPGFPWGRANLSVPDEATTARSSSDSAQFADPSRYTSLATIYSFLIRSQPVLDLIPGRPTSDKIAAQPFKDSSNSAGNLPVIGLSTTAGSPAAAEKLNRETITALRLYLERQQNATQVPDQQRAVVNVLNPPSEALVSQGRSLTKPIAVFLLFAIGATAFAYVLENLRMGRRREAFVVADPDVEALQDDPIVVNGASRRRATERVAS